MKKGWEIKKLGELCEVLDRKRKPITQRDRIAGNYPYYGATGILDYVHEYIFDERLILIGEDGAKWGAGENTAFIAEGKYWVNNHAHVIRPYNSIVLDNWIVHYLNFSDLQKHVTGLTVPKLNQEKMRDIPLPIPPLQEQKRIVAVMDEAFAAIATAKDNAEKNLKNAKTLFDSYLQSTMLSKKWKWKTLGELCDGVEYGSSAKSKKDGKVPVLRMGNIQDRKLDWENLAYSDDKNEIKKYLLKHNDVLFNRTNSPELVGKTAIYKSEMPAMFAGYLIRIHRKEDLLDADYLNYFLNSQIAFDYGKTVVISSVNQANINGSKLKGYPIPAPPLLEQQKIVKNLELLSAATQRLESIYKQKIAAFEELKKSLLHQAFNGEL